MARICEEYKKLIEEKIEKPIKLRLAKVRERCKKKKCKWWCLCCNKWFCWLEIFFLTVVKWIVTIVLKWVVYVVCRIVFFILDVLSNLVRLIGWILSRILSLPELALCLFGARLGTKNLRVSVFVIADDNEVPAVPLDTVAAHIKIAQSIYMSECQVRLEASKPMVVTGQTQLLTSHECGFLGWFSPKKGDYNSFAIGGRLAAIFVRAIPGTSIGCHIPGTNYVLVERDARDDTLAHELGHACDLFKHRNNTPENLMAEAKVRTGSKLTKWQCCVVRTSDNVTWT